jgi:CRISPR-associated endonuclease Csn1
MKKILGLDIGTNSIGWAFIHSNAYDNPDELNGEIIQLGSRIIPMDADSMKKFETGNPQSKAVERRMARGGRRLNQRYKLRRTRLIDALKILGWLPESFPKKFKNLTKHNIKDFLPFSEEIKTEAAIYFETIAKKTTTGQSFEIPEDWIIYFLKDKAKKQQISLVELARVLYHYNQRRGFKSSRKDAVLEKELNNTKYPLLEKWVENVLVTSIVGKEKRAGDEKEFTFYEITCQTTELEFKSIKKRKTPPDWLNKSIEVEITKKTTKDLTVSYSISPIDPEAWQSRKLALEKDLDYKNETISTYYLNKLKAEPYFRIKDRIVDRSRYQDELKTIWQKQSEFYFNLFNDQDKINAIADQFYLHNKEKNKELKNKGLFHIFFNDIIYYQRGLKSQKGFLANCQYEFKNYKDKNGELKKGNVKVISRSSPTFQEFRIWQTIHNLRILKNEEIINGKLHLNIDFTQKILTAESKEILFELFDASMEVSHDGIFKVLKIKKMKQANGEQSYPYSINFSAEKSWPANETKTLFRKIFKKHDFEEGGELLLNDKNLFTRLWHIVYSLPEEKDILKALGCDVFAKIPEAAKRHISKLPEFKSQYSSLSSKAINKLLPLMRVGKYWEETNIDIPSRIKINKIIDGEWDENISMNVRNLMKERNLTSITDFSGFPVFLAAYVVYGRHSESANEEKYETHEEFKINELIPYNSMRNPVVEKTIRETLKLVKDIWRHPDLGRPDYIHVELGRELKKNNEERKDLDNINTKNLVEKARITALLAELNYPNFNPNSFSDMDKFRVWKDNGGQKGEEDFQSLFKNNNAEFIKDADIEKYRCWAEQDYRSPYTGEIIPLSELFTSKFQIDHIIPRSRFFDDSNANKVVVEAEVNAEKDNRLAIQFIDDCQGREINLSNGKKVSISTLEDYNSFIDNVYSNKKKKKYLRLYEVPEDFVERQMNDTKYISKTVSQFLRKVAIGNDTDEGLIFTSGSITSDLKNKWGLNKLWKDILKPRFERLGKILDQDLIIPIDDNNNHYRFAKDYKRIDHRHHALDALIIACTTRGHIKYLNSLNSLSNSKKEIAKYNEWQKWKYLLNKKKILEGKNIGMTEFAPPWENFFINAKDALESVIVSHKPTSKLISKPFNKFKRFAEVEPGRWEKIEEKQKKPLNDDKYWVAVRQTLFALPLGTVTQPEYKKGIDLKTAIKAQIEFLKRKNNEWNSEDWRIAISAIRKQIDQQIRINEFNEKAILMHYQLNPILDGAGNVIVRLDLLRFKKYASKRRKIDEKFSKDVIKKMPGSFIKNNWLTNLLTDHLAINGDSPVRAFKGEELEQLFKKAPHPINKVTILDGEAKNKISLRNYLMEGVAGVNQFFLIEVINEIDKKTGETKIIRKYSTPPFLECLERLAKGLPIHDEDPSKQYFVLSPGEIVYVPKEGENIGHIDWSDRKKIARRCYLMVSSTETNCYFLPVNISSLIFPYDSNSKKGEFESMNKSEKTYDDERLIKAHFVKVKVDRLGNIKPYLPIGGNLMINL